MKWYALALLTLTIIFAFFSRDTLLGYIFPVSHTENYGALTVNAVTGDLVVSVDGREVGKAKSKLETQVEGIGTKEVDITSGSIPNAPIIHKTLPFSRDFVTLINYAVGPTVETSSGWIVTASYSNVPVVELIVNVPNASIVVTDNQSQAVSIEQGKFSFDKAQKYTIDVSADGYLPSKFTILGFEDADSQNLLNQKKITVFVDLFALPL